ncbi:MAG TPA: hypothetical protein VGV61_13820, partial [Thermoanaerobaculia bacterium]|nr:hypothetical protein [Thermoanaerobaculia bacterium]
MSRSAVRSLLLTLLVLSFATAASAQLLPPSPRANDERDLAALGRAASAGVAADLRLPGGTTAAFEGLLTGEALASHLVVVNLAGGGNRCALAVAGADGSLVAPLVSFTLRAGEERPILDALAPLGKVGVEPGRAELSCAGDF